MKFGEILFRMSAGDGQNRVKSKCCSKNREGKIIVIRTCKWRTNDVSSYEGLATGVPR